MSTSETHVLLFNTYNSIYLWNYNNLRSATTNPTGKNKLDAGRNGNMLIAKERITSIEWWLLFEGEDEDSHFVEHAE